MQDGGLGLTILPYSGGLNGRLPPEAKEKVKQVQAMSTLDHITVTPVDQFEWRIGF